MSSGEWPGQTYLNRPKIPIFMLKCPTTYDDGRMDLGELYSSFFKLNGHGWNSKQLCLSKTAIDNKKYSLPIFSFNSKRKGDAIWFISGIHGEEPAGPNALAKCVDLFAELSNHYPIVLLPLCNPVGYAKNWRYINMKTSSPKGFSVGDSGHLLLGKDNAPRTSNPLSLESKALASHVIELSKSYHPKFVFDLHEDSMSELGYVYCHGDKSLAKSAVGILGMNGVHAPISGQTRFGEKINDGIIDAVEDGSIDELLSSEKIIVDGKYTVGPCADNVLVIETPSKNTAIEKRIQAHFSLVHHTVAKLGIIGRTHSFPYYVNP